MTCTFLSARNGGELEARRHQGGRKWQTSGDGELLSPGKFMPPIRWCGNQGDESG